MDDNDKSGLIELTADIASAYVSNNSVAAGDLPSIIQSIFKALAVVDRPWPRSSASRPSGSPGSSWSRSCRQC